MIKHGVAEIEPAPESRLIATFWHIRRLGMLLSLLAARPGAEGFLPTTPIASGFSSRNTPAFCNRLSVSAGGLLAGRCVSSVSPILSPVSEGETQRPRASCRSVGPDRFISLATLSTGVFAFECALRVFKSSFEHKRRLEVLLGFLVSAPRGPPLQ